MMGPDEVRAERAKALAALAMARARLAEVRRECAHPDRYRTHNMDLVCRDCGRRW